MYGIYSREDIKWLERRPLRFMEAASVRLSRRMTREDFEAWCLRHDVAVQAQKPYDIVPCDCGDLNCHGWRFVARHG